MTVAGSGGAGVTVQGAAAVTSASSVCSSLSTRACYGLQEGYCTAFGTASATPTSGVFVNPTGDASRQSSSLYDLAIGLAAGLCAMFL